MTTNNFARKIICFLLAATMLLMVGCDGGNQGDITSSEDTSSKPKRELPEVDKLVSEEYVPEYKVSAQKWDGPEGYSIVYSDKTTGAYALALSLQDFFKTNCGVSLTVEKDNSKAASDSRKEILVGNTNRYTTSLSESQFKVSLNGNKLVFEGGHFAMVEKAVDWFITEKYEEGSVNTLEGTAKDFKATLEGGYEYVWGDEFDGNYLDSTKFNEYNHMGRTDDMRVLFGDKKVTNVDEGLLKLKGIRYYDESNAQYEYAVGSSLCTGDTMWWKYGYAEIRARIPMKQGAWPAWWTTTFCNSSSYCMNKLDISKWQYMIEVDMFEVFSSTTEITPTMHKWYKSGGSNEKLDFKKFLNKDGSRIEQTDTKWEPYKLEENDNNSFVYHVFGFEWTPTDIILTIDGNVYGKMNFNTENIDEYTSMDDFKNQYMHMIFDNWLYAPLHKETIKHPEVQIVPESLPTEFFIDYVRLYQIPGQGSIKNLGLENLK